MSALLRYWLRLARNRNNMRKKRAARTPEQRATENAARREAGQAKPMTPERKRVVAAAAKRWRVRKELAAEAAQTGQPAEELFAQWGVEKRRYL